MHPLHDAPQPRPSPALPRTYRGRAAPTAEPSTPAASPGLRELERALAAYAPETLLAGESAAGEALRAAARLLAAEARMQDPVRAERLLIALRRAWGKLPEIERVPADGQRRALWDRLVCLCCEEFYAPARPAGAPPNAGAAAGR